jgi:hypothetical protein
MRKILLLAAILGFANLNAQDRLFTYTYQSNVLNKGQKEIEAWNTFRTGRNDFYSRLDNRTEYEIGLGGNLQTAFYLNLTSITSTINDAGTKGLKTENEISFSNEWKLKLSDPVANAIGMALYGEFTIGSREYELEGKMIFDKRVNRLTITANAVYELEIEPEPQAEKTDWTKEQKADCHLALAYSLSPKFALTLENSWQNVIAGGVLEHSALYSGLGMSYNQENFWVNFTVLPQVKSFKGQTGSSLNFNEFEKIQFRLLFSYVL